MGNTIVHLRDDVYVVFLPQKNLEAITMVHFAIIVATCFLHSGILEAVTIVHFAIIIATCFLYSRLVYRIRKELTGSRGRPYLRYSSVCFSFLRHLCLT